MLNLRRSSNTRRSSEGGAVKEWLKGWDRPRFLHSASTIMAARGRGRRNRWRKQKSDNKKDDEPSYTVDDICFVNDPPDFLQIECPVCLQIMLNETLLTNCCGRHFCGSCMRKIQSTGGACPCCNAVRYQSFPNKEKLRTIRGLRVHCNNDESGCQWKGELKDLSGHMNEGKREGPCKFEIVKCRYHCKTEHKIYCDVQQERWLLDDHEKSCPNRPYLCQYCSYQGRYHDITSGNHFKTCPKYLVSCPNSCEGGKVFQRGALQLHLDVNCPLETVKCPWFNNGSCQEKLLRKDMQEHLLFCNFKHAFVIYTKQQDYNELNNELEKVKKENTTLWKLCNDMKREIRNFKRIHQDMEQRIASLEDD